MFDYLTICNGLALYANVIKGEIFFASKEADARVILDVQEKG